MERLIHHGKYYNPYKILDKIHEVMSDYNLYLIIKENYSLANCYTHEYKSGWIQISVTNNVKNEQFFDISIEYFKEPYPIYKRTNMDLSKKEKFTELIEVFKDVIHRYKDDLEVASKRIVIISSIID